MSFRFDSSETIYGDDWEPIDSVNQQPLLDDGRSKPQETTPTTPPTISFVPHLERPSEATTERSGFNDDKDRAKLFMDRLSLEGSRNPSGSYDLKEFGAAALQKREAELRRHQELLNREKELLNRMQERRTSEKIFKRREDFLRLYPGRPDFRERFIQKHASRSRQPVKCTLHMRDVFSEFLASELEGGSFWDLVVLTGRPGDQIEAGLWVTTCRDYVTAVWPNSAHKIKDMFMLLGATGDDVRVAGKLVSGASDDVLVLVSQHLLVDGRRELSISFDGSAESQFEMVESLTWLFAILQSSASYKRPFASGIEWSRRKSDHIQTRDKIYELSNDLFEPLILPCYSACWTPLLPCTPCAVDFGTRGRPRDMQGLEPSFELMCFLSGLEYEVVEDEGLVLYGQRSMVYPVRAVADCVQWRFQRYNTDRPLKNPITGQRMPVYDLESLREAKRHFLGLWPDPSITLGTDSVDYTKIVWSAAEEVLRETKGDGFSFGGSVGAPKTLSLNWNQNFKVAQSRKNQYMVHFETNLHRMINSPVILYSPSEKRAWMVSFVSVLLHLARARASFQASLGFHVPPCERRGNGGQAAFNCLRACYSQPLKKPAENEPLSEEEQKYTIQNYVNEVSAAVECARRESCRAKGILRGVREKIIGFELADIARMKPTLRMKQYSLDAFAPSGWAPLLNDVQLTFFYEGLPDPIIPSEASRFPGACGKSVWRTIPTGFNLLAVSLPCLVHLTEDQNGGSNTLQRLTREFSWHCPGEVYRICDRQTPHSCSRLQALAPRARADSPKIPISDGEQVGAVVFQYADGFRKIVESMNWEVYHRGSENAPLSGLDSQLPSPESLFLSPRPTLGGSDSGFSSGGNRDASASSIQSSLVGPPPSDVSQSEQTRRLEDGGEARLDQPPGALQQHRRRSGEDDERSDPSRHPTEGGSVRLPVDWRAGESRKGLRRLCADYVLGMRRIFAGGPKSSKAAKP